MFRMIQNGSKWIKLCKKDQKEFTVFKLSLRNLDFAPSYTPMHKFCACYFNTPHSYNRGSQDKNMPAPGFQDIWPSVRGLRV